MTEMTPIDTRSDRRPGPSALETFLAIDPDFRGIGPARAATLTAAFGKRLHAALLTKHPEVVTLLSDIIAETLFEIYEQKSSEATLLTWMETRGLSDVIGPATVVRIARCWGPSGAEALMANPCELAAFLPWRTVDQVRAALGLPEDDPRRAVAAVETFLYARLQQNHTWTPRAATEAGAGKLLGGAAAPAGQPVGRWAVSCALAAGAVEEFEDGLQPLGAATMEAFLATELARLGLTPPIADLATSPVSDDDLDAALADFCQAQPHALTSAQLSAIRLVFRARLSVLAGYAGSGKTTSLRGLCDLAERFGRTVYLIALSGRAAQRMAQATGREAMTIARFLRRNSEGPDSDLPPGSIVVIDEASMVDLPMLWRIVRRLGEAALVMVGDPAQLPPIGFGLTFHGLVEASRTPITVLERVMRQTADSGIPAVAEAIRSGRAPCLATFSGYTPGVSFLERSPTDATQAILAVGLRLVADGMPRGEAQIIAPVKGGPAGALAINALLHGLRRTARIRPNLVPGRPDIAEGDPVVWTRNDYERDLMNGSMGRILAVSSGKVRAVFDAVEHILDPVDCQDIELAYAITVHKAQGSQWPVVIVPVYPSRILDRTLIYTAATRAIEQVVFVGDLRAFNEAIVSRPQASGRSTTLGLRLKSSGGEARFGVNHFDG